MASCIAFEAIFVVYFLDVSHFSSCCWSLRCSHSFPSSYSWSHFTTHLIFPLVGGPVGWCLQTSNGRKLHKPLLGRNVRDDGDLTNKTDSVVFWSRAPPVSAGSGFQRWDFGSPAAIPNATVCLDWIAEWCPDERLLVEWTVPPSGGPHRNLPERNIERKFDNLFD